MALLPLNQLHLPRTSRYDTGDVTIQSSSGLYSHLERAYTAVQGQSQYGTEQDLRPLGMCVSFEVGNYF